MSKEQAYDEKISPLMAQIIAICKEHQIPLLATFNLQNDDEDVMNCTTALLDEAWDVPKKMLEAYRCIYPPERSPLIVKTYDGNGNITRMDAIL